MTPDEIVNTIQQATFEPLKKLRGTTHSGRVYQLLGSPGHSADGAYVWSQWQIVNGVKSFCDVTEEIWKGGK